LLVAFPDKLVIFCAEVLSQHDAAAILVMFGTCGLPGELCGKDYPLPYPALPLLIDDECN